MPAGARIGTEVAGYRVESLIARGGTSTVYRAEYPRLGIPVALKLLNEELALDESFRERFVRESRVAAGINHPNIITIYDAGVWEDTLYIAMRLVAGGDLKDRLKGTPLEPRRALAILGQVGSGLDAAHAHGLVHRDVKPANIMIDSGPGEESPEIAFVTDFGLMKHAQSGGRPTPTGEFLGTIAYVAPEQIEGRTADARADVYSLGCVAFECLVGKAPFQRESDAATLWAHMQESPPSVASARPDLPVTLDPILARSLAKDREARYQSCGELVASLREALGDEGPASTVTVGVPVAPPRVVRRERRRSRLLPVALLAVGLVLGALGAALALALAGDDGTPSAGAAGEGATATAVRTVTELDDVFLAPVVPQQLRDSCRRAVAPDEFWYAYRCTPAPGSGATVVRYSYARSGPLMGDYFKRRWVRAGVEPFRGSRQPPHVPSCRVPNPVGLEEWVWEGASGHRLIGKTPSGDSDGRVLCVPDVGGRPARIEWATYILGVFGYAEGPNYAALLSWWLESGGPIRH